MRFKVYSNPNPEPKARKRRWNGLRMLLLLLVLIAVFVSIGVEIITDYIWMDSLGFSRVFTTIFFSKLLLGGLGFALYASGTFATLWWIRRTYVNAIPHEQLPSLFLRKKRMLLLTAGISFLPGIIGSNIAQGFGWERFLNYFHRTPFGLQDPIFHRDISFYVFTLPLWKFIIGMLLGLCVMLLLVQLAAYSVFRLFLYNRSAQIHLGTTFALLGILLTLRHLLAPYETLLTNRVNLFQESVVYGFSYTDRWVNVPKAYLLAAVALLGTGWMIYSMMRGRWRGMLMPVIAYLAVSAAGQAVSIAVQSLVVSPNEFAKESPYLEHNLVYTRQAYGLDKVKEAEHPGNLTLDRAMLERNRRTIENIRINDARPLLDVYNQLQTFRTYYEFNDVDVDRYYVDGKYQQVFVAARELNISHLPEQAQTWTNQKLRYTHGYGIAMSQVNAVTEQGQPQYMVKNLPPSGKPEVKRPQIYFGEEPYEDVIVNTRVDEFDYPEGDANVTNRFAAKSGIPLNGLNRLLFAIEAKSLRMLVSGQITSESQLLATRNILERLEKIAPFLTYDKDPYIVVRDDGTLVWLVDAYTRSSRFPYSEAVQNNVNYIRNPVKAMVDAYTGEVRFYVVEPDEPLLQTYRKIFPTLFTDEIPGDIRAHFRYPETLFTVQASMYRAYHMTNLEVFYNREDFWQFPTEKYYDKDITMEPYYVTMRLPRSEREEFILMLPFTPKNRQNMIAWMAARNDGEHYGELLVYRFPKQKTVYGPQQIENRINQNGEISQKLNLWSQGGSKVIRGNLLVVPIEDTLLYVEPLYIESANETSLPEVKQMILAYGDKIVMEDHFDKALSRLLEMIGEEAAPDAGKERGIGAPPGLPLQEAEEALRRVARLFQAYREAIANGRWEESGRIMQQMEEQLQGIAETDGSASETPPENREGFGNGNGAPETENGEMPEAGNR
ncbi:UPF0182 family protein [Bacillaceae bacterium]